MATDGQMPMGSGSNLDVMRQRAQKAAEYYQQQQDYRGVDQASGLASPSSMSSRDYRMPPQQYAENYSNNKGYTADAGRGNSSAPSNVAGGGGSGNAYSSNVGRVLAEDTFDTAMAPPTSNSFYRAKMRAGIIDMRSSYNERIGAGTRNRARTFHGPHTGPRARTQTYALDSKQQPSPANPVHHGQQDQQQQLPAPQKPARTYATNKAMLHRSSSDLEVDSVELDTPPPAPSTLHREYGSTSSLDVLGTSTDNFFSMISEFRQHHALDQRSPAPPRLQELLQGRLEASSEPHIQTAESAKGSVKFLNGLTSADKDVITDDVDSGKGNKNKTKHKERKQRAKSITGEGSASILKKLRGKMESEVSALKSEDRVSAGDELPGRPEDHSRRRIFVHFDCQSVGVDLAQVIHQRIHGGSLKNNMTTGASAASGQRSSLAPDKDDPDILADTDEGDGKSNELVLSCPFFRNELGGEDERTVSLTKLTAHKRVSATGSSPVSQPPMDTILVRHPACCGVAILDSSPSPSGQILPPLVSHRGHVIEYVDHGAYYYRHFFYTHDHQNLFGTDENLGPVAISVRREKLDLDDRTNNLGRADYGSNQYRIICRTSELTTLRGCVLEEAIPSRLSSSRGIPIKDVLEVAVPEVQLSCLRQGMAGPKTCEQLLKLDEQGISNTYKVGIMYCKSGQASEEEMYNNESGGPALEEFLSLVSQRVRLKGFEKYRAGLDCKTDTTGTHSYYTTFNNNEIMFHVSTMLPYTPNNKQQLLRKRHIGNDIVTIVFQEPGALPFTPQTVRSQFQHVFIIVRVSNPNSDNTRYSLAITRSKDVPPFGPPIPEHCSFKKSQEFVDFLLAKLINSENAAHKSNKFLTMATRTRQEYLKDLATNYVTNTPIDSGSKLSKFGLGSGRKKEKPKQKVVPDMFAKGALVWEVQVEDMGTASQVECLLAVAADTIVLVEQVNKDVIFTIPCSTVIGWTPQPSSLRMYFGSGECLLLRPLSGEVEEMHEMITRLQAVTNGTETSKMALKRNGLGQLGFHIQSEGIVTDVEPYGFAWEAGLRKGSRLVEICKVATTTLSHDQIVDLLRTSAVVKVVVVPPMDDGSPRGFISLTTHLPHTSMMSLNAIMISETLHAPSPSPSEPSFLLTRGDNSISLTSPLPSSSTSVGSKPSPSSNSQQQQQQQQHQQQASSSVFESPRQRPVTTHHGYSDSTLSSGRSSDDGRSSYFGHTRQESADMYGSVRGSHEGHTSSGEEPHSRNNSHDSSDYSLSALSARSRSSQHNQPPLRRGERVAASTDVSMDSSVYGSAATNKRQFANMEYSSSIPATGNIALELLKQTQNTKYLLGQGQGQAPSRSAVEQGRSVQDGTNPGSASNLSQISEGSSSGSSQYTHRNESGKLIKEEVGAPRRKDGSVMSRSMKPVMKKGLTEPSTSSPRATRRNLSGMSSEESLNSRLRPGVTGQKFTRQVARADFQEELMRLIDPDLSENDLVGYNSRGSTSRKSGRLQRTLSDESLHNSKGTSSDLLPTKSEDSPTQRLSPRALSDLISARQRSKSTIDNRALPVLESAAALDWSKLVNVASKVIDETDSKSSSRSGNGHLREENGSSPEDRPPPRPPSPQMNIGLPTSSAGMSASYMSLATTPQQRIQELEQRLDKVSHELDKVRKEKSSMEAEIQDLRADNVRLQEESQTAATQLRRFTEWFFNTIDRQ
ncbi:signal-induced proliferation-associated 1-like protein 1 [Aplysia californica]|uniref:Signal-induced proliferation-associated 1-like protein 1 n=1 Tax=Aplysia californica TaxID=6500 RepID=A0ABM0JHG2_APLCA|nr:signal-induced proliferation-associated 1-like protein 1 [Aplysia californica]